MKDFPGYEKIAESLDKWRLEPSAFRLLRKAEWVVTEKMHGANFCLASDGQTVRCANRRAWLAPGELFFGHETVRDALAEKIEALFHCLRAEQTDIACLYLYGELFGGAYPHPDVIPTPGIQPIQTGVWYAPDIRFCAFDLRIENAAGKRRYLDYVEVIKRCTEVGIFAATPLFVGKYEAAMEREIRFDSTIPRVLGLPALPAGTNLAEGVVTKPYREIVLTTENGDTIRPVLKRKITEFAEDKRFHEATKWGDSRQAGVSPLDLLQWEASCRIVENRLNAAISKIGYVPGKTREKAPLLFMLLTNEVRDETQAALPDAWAALSPSDRETLQRFIAAHVRGLLRTKPK